MPCLRCFAVSLGCALQLINSSLGKLISFGSTLEFDTSKFWSTGVESWYVMA